MDSPVSGINVRSMISIFESQSFSHEREERATIKRTTSLGSLRARTPQSDSPSFSSSMAHSRSTHFLAVPSAELLDIERQLKTIQSKLNSYEGYSKDNHILYQNELLGLFGDIVTIDSREDVWTINKKRELTELIKHLNRVLNSHLPIGSAFKKTKAEAKVTKTVVEEKKKVVEEKKIDDQKAKGEPTDTTSVVSLASSDSAPSVRRLRSLFELRSSEGDGLVSLVRDPKESTPRRYHSFNGTPRTNGDFMYRESSPKKAALARSVSEKAKSSSDEEDAQSVERVVHNASIYRRANIPSPVFIRRSSSKVSDLKNLFENNLVASVEAQKRREKEEEEEEKLAKLEAEAQKIELMEERQNRKSESESEEEFEERQQQPPKIQEEEEYEEEHQDSIDRDGSVSQVSLNRDDASSSSGSSVDY